MKRALLAAVAVGTILCAGCRGGETGPVAGDLIVRLTTPSNTDRAILFQLVGKLTAVRPASGSNYRVFSAAMIGDTVRIAVVAPRNSAIGAGELVRFSVPDTRKVGSYTVTVTDVAGADYSIANPGQYSLVIVRP